MLITMIRKCGRRFLLRPFGVLLCTGLAVLANPANAQNGFFEGTIAYPLTESGVTFSEAYSGQMHVGLSYTHVLQRHFRLGVSMEYARFVDPGPYDSHVSFLMPSVLAVYGTHFSGRHRFEGTLQGGAAWMLYRSENPGFVSFDDTGLYVAPGIRFVFQATPGVKAQMGVGYKVIFEHFGDDAVSQDATTRYLVFGTGIMLGI